MIKCRTIKDFTLEKYNEITNIKRKLLEEKGKLFAGDEFECKEDMARYLLGDNPANAKVVEMIEIIPEKKK